MPKTKQISTSWRKTSLAYSLALLFTGCGTSDSADPSIGTLGADLYVLSTSIWSSPDIPVCWETAGNDTQKGWVRDALSKAWEAESNVNFTGFGLCTASSQGIRIRTADEWPQTTALGKNLNGVTNGMTLNFWYQFRDTTGFRPFGSCVGQEESCTRAIAVHEFGHALGFAHEQNRSDTPTTCTQAPQGTSGDSTVGPWDLMSTMNYCNPVYNNGGLPSPTDIWGVQKYYGGRKPIAASTRASGRLDVAVHNASDNLLIYSWDGLAWSTAAQANAINDTPGLATPGSSRLDAFVRGSDGALYTKTWNGTSWGGYSQLGSSVIVGNPVAISAGANNLQVVVRGTDNALYANAWNGSSWSGYVGLGGSFVGTPAVVARGTSRIDVFMRGTDNTLQTAFWNGSSWSPVTQLGTEPIASNPAAVAWDTSRVDVFVRGTDGKIYTKSLTGSWTGYTNLGASTFYGDPAVASWGPNRIDLFARGTDGKLYTKSWNGSVWNSFSALGNSQFLASPSVVSWGANRLDVFVRGTDGALYTQSWNGWVWSGFTGLGGSVL